MKVAFHFKCTGIEERYDLLFYRVVFNRLLSFERQFISTKILIGDLLHHDALRKSNDPESLMLNLFQIDADTWKRILPKKVEYFLNQDVFVICFETLQKEIAEILHLSLINEEHYLGAFEIDDTVGGHWALYNSGLVTAFRLIDNEINILIESNTPEYLEHANDMKSSLRDIPFKKISFELTNYRKTIFDDDHTFNNAKKNREWKVGIDSIFESISDQIISKLIDAAPDITNRLWAITDTFKNAKTGEQYAQVMSSCRRLFEYISDCLFPATDEKVDGFKLDKGKYKNRLMAFASKEMKSESNIDLIISNTQFLFDEWVKLYDLSNKGVHGEPHRQECRRCLIRTVLLLDDLIALKRTPFEVRINSSEFLDDLIERYNNQLNKK